MMLTRRSVVGSAAVATTALALGPDALAAPGRRRRARSAEGGQAVLDWEQVSFDTVYGVLGTTPPRTGIPVGAPVLGFVSLAMYRAASWSAHLGSSSESAAVAQAAHDVLLAYYPGQAGPLQTALDNTMDAVGPGQARTKGSRIGAEAARDMLRSREDDGYLDRSVPYTSRTPPPTGSRRPSRLRCRWQVPCSAPGSARSGTSSSRRRRSPVRTPSGLPRGPTTTRRSERWAATTRPSGRPDRRRRRCSTTPPTPREPSATR